MDSSLAIELKSICKAFKVEVENKEKEKTALNRNPTKTVEHVVLDHLDLQVKKGELLGIIGLNGSGKSTLLSIMARIMEPDSGTIETNGKVSSILELGMGFHPDLSGRENIYIKGEMYGYSKKQMDEKVDEIIDFAGIREYIDNPLRTYSSGMSGRLAFSVMVHVDAEVMLLDEIMSTGDPSFTTKADNLFKKQLKSGRTVVFASQNTSQIEQLCTRVIWIQKGKIVADGPAKSVCAMFQNAINESIDIIVDFANNGVADSQYKLALMYRDGLKVEKDQELYRFWLNKAASQGHAQAQVVYADLLINSSLPQEQSDAISFYQSAALKGNPEARMKLSIISGNSNTTKDRDEIRNIFRQLAEKGHPYNKYQFAMLMMQTAWTQEDRKEAFTWMKTCADEGNPDAMLQLANMYRDGNGTVKDTKQYIKYLESSADYGNFWAIKGLAEIYLTGKIVMKDDKKAFDYYLKGALQGNGGMQYQIAVMYRDGIGIEKNIAESEKWFAIFSNSILANYQIMAADQLKLFDIDTNATPEELLVKAASVYNLRAINTLGNMYRGDSVLPANKEKAREYYLMAAQWPGNTRIALADMYYKGLVFEQDFVKSASLYEKLTYICDANIDYRLYHMYHNGLGFKKNEEKALIYLKRSASRGNLDARLVLKEMQKTKQE